MTKPFPRLFRGGITARVSTIRLPNGDAHGVLHVAPEGVLLDRSSLTELIDTLRGLRAELDDDLTPMPQLLDSPEAEGVIPPEFSQDDEGLWWRQ
jgi:hypothetical protein